MILHLYFVRKFMIWFGLVFAVFFGIVLLVDLVEQIRRYDGDTAGLRQATVLALLNAPANLYRILPLLIILSTLGLFLGLARTSEMVVTRASGRSALRSLAAPTMAAFALGAIAVSVWNPIVAGTSRQYENITNRLQQGADSVLSISREGLWLRQGRTGEQTVIHARRATLEGTELFQATFVGFDATGVPVFRIEARRAELASGAWILLDAKLWRFDQTNPEITAKTFQRYELPSNLTRDEIREGFGTPSAIPIWELPEFIQRLEQAGFSAIQHKVWFWMELATPLMLVAMVLIAAGFTMRHTRFGRTGMMVLSALLLGFGVFFLRNFAQILGENGQIPVQLATWSPPLAGILLSLGLLLHTEDG